MKHRTFFKGFCCALVVALFGAGALAVAATQAPARHSLPPIRSQADLARYLHATPPGQSPLDLLPAGARKRFLGSLVFGRHGLGGFAFDDLQALLTNSQIHQVLGLFGPETQTYADNLQGRKQPLTAAERTAPESAFELKYDKFYLADKKVAPAQFRAVTLADYDKLISATQQPATLHKLGNHDLVLLYRAAIKAAAWSTAPRYLGDLRRDFDALRQRGLLNDERIGLFYQRLVAARQFKAANQLAARDPASDLAVLPSVWVPVALPAGEPTVLRWDISRHKLLHEAVDLNDGLHIVVVAGCHFSEDAARAIRSDPALDRLFHAHAIWLANQNESLPATQAWNREFPDQPMYVAWKDSEWQRLDNWAMPTFYIFKHGKLAGEWSGWPSDTKMIPYVHKKLHEAGVL